MGERHKTTIYILMCLFIIRISSVKKEYTTTRKYLLLNKLGLLLIVARKNAHMVDLGASQ